MILFLTLKITAMNKRIIKKQVVGVLVLIAWLQISCVDSFLPEERDAYDRDATYNLRIGLTPHNKLSRVFADIK